MTPLPPPEGPLPDALTPDENRYLDGEMSAQEAHSMELRLAADPERAAHIAAWRDAMDLWRDDARRAAAGVAAEPDDLADRILDGLSGEAPQFLGGATALDRRRAVAPQAARWYAAAAVLLMAVGVTGTLLARPAPADRSARPQVSPFDEVFLEVLAEGSEFNPRLALSKEGR